MPNIAIAAESICTHFGDAIVHQNISFAIPSGEVVAVIGGSGSGKSTLLREFIRLQPPTSGRCLLFDQDVWGTSEEQFNHLRKRFGVLFQYSALFSGLPLGENVALPLVEERCYPRSFIEDIVELRLKLVGLTSDDYYKMPSELSGGMRKRAALARALALEPEIVFLDEPTSGLDPINARAFDSLVRTLRDSLRLTVFMVTHDLESIVHATDRVIALGDGVVLANGTADDVMRVAHPWIQEYFAQVRKEI